ncbi:hypothetical protein ERJ75_001103700 [Trypanosoma vivax]|nr:hypothetical protein ERJ75_001103700 [Trypanosoma vivax]
MRTYFLGTGAKQACSCSPRRDAQGGTNTSIGDRRDTKKGGKICACGTSDCLWDVAASTHRWNGTAVILPSAGARRLRCNARHADFEAGTRSARGREGCAVAEGQERRRGRREGGREEPDESQEQRTEPKAREESDGKGHLPARGSGSVARMLADKRQEEYGVNGNDTEEKRRPALGVVEVGQRERGRNEVTCGVETGEGSEHQRGEGPDLRSDTNPAPGCDCVFRFFALCGFTIGKRFFACKGEQAKLGEEQGREVLGKTRRSAGREWVASVAKAGHRQRK